MDEAIGVTVLIAIAIMFFSFKISKQFSKEVFFVVYVGAVVAIISTQGFTAQSFIGICGLSFFFLFMYVRAAIIWLKINKGHTWLDDKLSQNNYSTCKVCGQKLFYHRTPKNLNQILFGGLTCENCEAEFSVPYD